MIYQLLYTEMFNDCLKQYDGNTKVKANVADATSWLSTNPFLDPRLTTHKAKRAVENTYISDVGGRKGKRLIWRLVDRVIVLLLIGEHDPVERRAERVRLQANPETGELNVFDADPVSNDAAPYHELRQQVGSLFMAWDDLTLAAFGFQAQEIPVLRSLDSEAELLALENRMRIVAYDRASNLYLYGHPDGEAAATAERDAAESMVEAAVATVPTPEERAIASKLVAAGASSEFRVVDPDELREILERPIEDWMIFLHPDQERLAARSYAGPARVRGAAGTGKTVVGLHRVKHLVRSYPEGKILVTSYLRTLPPVLKNLYARLDPKGAERVEFSGLHRWAMSFVRQANSHLTIDDGLVRAAFYAAWKEVAPAGSPLAASGLPHRYFQEEIDWVIKGRGLRTSSAYLSLQRNGRGTPLNAALRSAVWALYDEYQHQLRKRKTRDWNDLISEALMLVRERGLDEPYVSVIVDECQDLTENAVRLVYELAGRSKPDGLVLLGDGQQSVYPGGYSLGALGINVVGRSTVLRVNYRNTREILDAATRIVFDRPYDDNQEEIEHGERDVIVLRTGREPHFEGYDDADDHDEALTLGIAAAVGRPGTTPGDVAVLVPTNMMVEHYTALIAGLGFPTQKLSDYEGVRNSKVKVGTYQRSKGLEFKAVFLPRLDPGTLHEAKEGREDAETHAERVDLLARNIYVSMTRARDDLWCGWVGRPAELLRRQDQGA